MDIQTSLIYAGVLVSCAAIVYITSILGIREKTYDEAIAEQRQMPNEELLLARSNKEKKKDKKSKKETGKKVKEKPAEKEKSGQKVDVPDAGSSHPHGHVEFIEPEAEVLSEHPPQDEKKKKKKIKPILIHKNEQKVLVANKTLLANHFEESLPKDDLLLKRQASQEDVLAKTGLIKGHSKPEKAVKNEKANAPKTEAAPLKAEKTASPKGDKTASQKLEKNIANKTEKTAPEKKQEKKPEKISPPEKKPEKAPVPEKKQEKPVSASKQDKSAASKQEKPVEKKVEKPAAPKNVPTKVEKSAGKAEKAAVEEKAVVASVVEPVAAVAKDQRSQKKKKNELATLQQMSGDREGVNVSLIVPLVQKAELSRSEIQNLIDLLLNKQQGSAVANAEWIEGRQDPMVKLKKQLAEKEKALSEEQEAAQAVQSKLRELRAEINTDRSRWRQMEESAASKHLEIQHLTTRLQLAQEAHKTEKAQMSQQLQQLQGKIADDHVVIRKLQEEQVAMKQEFHGQRQQMELHIAHLTNEHQELEAALKSQLQQLHAQLQEQEQVAQQMRADTQNACETAMSRDADNKMYREQVNHLTGEVRRQESIAQDLNRQVEEMHHLKSKLDHRISSGARVESQLQYECDALRQEVAALNAALAERDSVTVGAKAERDELAATVAKLQADARKAGEESERLASQLSGLQKDSRQLKEENETLAAQVTERPAAEGRENGDVAYPEEKPLATKEETSQLNNLLKQKEAEVEELSTQIINHKTEISKLNEDLEAQRQKNNESSNSARLEEQRASKQLLERIFPNVKPPSVTSHVAWVEQFLSSALKSVPVPTPPVDESLAVKVADQEKQIAQLTAVSAKYKTIISETESLLKKLQDSAEEEEAKWSAKVRQREAEVEALKEDRERLERAVDDVSGSQQMQSKLLELEAKLHSEEVEKRELTEKYTEICSLLQSRDSDQLEANVRQLSEEQSRLKEDLAAAREKEREMSKEVTKLRALVQIGQESLSQEHRLTQDLQHQVDKLNGVRENHSVATNGGDTETSIPEAGSVKK